MTDDPVVAGAKAGDPEAWRALYREHAGRLLVWLETRAGTDVAVAAEDVAAETWLRAAEKVADYTGTAADFGGWLFGIARRVAANTRRRSGRRRTHPVEDAPLLPTVPGPEVGVQEREWVRELLSTLSPRERDVLACIDVVGLSVAETGTALSMTPVAVRVAHHRALRRLRRRATAAPLFPSTQ